MGFEVKITCSPAAWIKGYKRTPGANSCAWATRLAFWWLCTVCSISIAIADLHHWSLMGQQTLLLLFPVYCECPGATWHHSAVRCPVIQPSLTDCQCRGLQVLMQMGKAFPSPLPLFEQTSSRVAGELHLYFESLPYAFKFGVVFWLIFNVNICSFKLATALSVL